MKKLLCLILSVCMLSAFALTVSATEIGSAIKTERYAANIEFVGNVNETGTNITGDKADGDSIRASMNYITVGQKNDHSISVAVLLGDEKVTISGVPVGRTESGKTIFFTSNTSDARYEVVNFAYVTDTSVTNMYFKNAKAVKHPSATSMLKIYIKDTASETLDYYFVESFGVELDYQNEYILALPVNPLLGAWTATQFQPVATEFREVASDTSSRASTTKSWYCTKSFYDISEYTTHTISWRTNADCTNVRVGGDGAQSHSITVYAKSMSFEVNTDLNSSTSSYLHINGVKLRQTSVPNTAWKSVQLDGSVHKNSIFSGGLSASLGFSWGLLGVSYSIPLNFDFETTLDIDENYSSFQNNINGQYLRSIETEMDSRHRLTEIGHYFAVDTVLRDYGNTTQSAKSLLATWDVEIINLGTMDYYSYTCVHNSSVSITN